MTDGGNGELTVQRMYPAHGRAPVVYGSLTRDRDAEACKLLLVSTLWEQVLALKSPLWEQCQTSGRATFPVQVLSGPLGKPCLRVGEFRGPTVSFSEGGGKVWAALSPDESDIGIDVAGADEFPQDYPVHRVFHPEELQHALRLAGGDRAHACALIWSIKEAFVKALGCAFHFVDPLQVRVFTPAEETPGKDGAYVFPVGLSAKHQSWVPRSASRHLSVSSRPLSRMWLSLAHLNPGAAVHE